MMLKKLTLLFAVLSLTGVVFLGCGDDDDGGNKTDAGGDSPTSETGGDSGPDGGPCNFNDFVTNLVNNSTTATALPSTDLGDKCADEQKLFPQTIF